MPDASGTAPTAQELLLRDVEAIERLDEQIADLKQDRKDILARIKSNGFDTKTVGRVLKRRRMTAAEREEEDALLELYERSLGMLSDTPLGEAAVRRLTRRPGADPAQGDLEEASRRPRPEDDPHPGASLDDARRMGEEAGRGRRPVTENPFPAGDPRRGAWDQAWCLAAGSDGMDVPEAWKRTAPKGERKGRRKPGDGE